MSQRYDIFFAAQLIDGFDESTVRANIAALFKANDATLEKLFSGKPQLIKRGVDKAAAIKYKSALKKAGAVALVRVQPEPIKEPEEEVEEELPSSAAIKPPATEPATSMAERLAALTAEPAAVTATFGEGISLAPTGSDVLNEDERQVFEELDIDTSAIHLSSAAEQLEPKPTEPAPPAPDTSHLSMGDVGEEIPHLETTEEAVDPDISHLSMGEVGEDIPHLVEEREEVHPDTSGIDLAPEGSEVLEEQYRKTDDVQAPSTDHISLAEGGPAD
jgi:hypothetical protein